MKDNTLQIIKNYENRLKEAMLSSNTEELEILLSDDLVFTDHTGAVRSKTDDINAHKSGFVSINAIEFFDQKIIAFKNTAVVSVIMEISGIFGGEHASGKFRFTRNWIQSDKDHWQLVAGHSTLLPQ